MVWYIPSDMYIYLQINYAISSIHSVRYEYLFITLYKAKQINILGSRQHPAEKVALWCEFFFFFFFFLSAVKSRGIPMLTNMYLMVHEQYKFHLSIVCDM